MTETIPKQVPREIRQEIAALRMPWRIVKKRDHYFLHIEGMPRICVASNSSKATDYQIMKSLERIKKVSNDNQG